MTDYHQAEQFLANTGTEFGIKYLRTGKHFYNDAHADRDIYRFTLRNSKGEYSAEFGGSIHNTQLRQAGARNSSPTAYDVLSCLQKSDPGSFIDFVSDYGYSNLPLVEYPQVMGIYHAVLREYTALQRMFTTEELESLQEIS